MVKTAQKFPILHLDLLHPQSNPEKIPIKITKWLLSTGRFIIVFVELIVLSAFLARFKLDADLANYKESIDQQIPYIKSLKTDEIMIRQLQQQLSTIKTIKASEANFAPVFKAIATQTPQGIKVSNINIEVNETKTTLKIIGMAENDSELATLLYGIQSISSFTDVTLGNVSLNKNQINFTISGSINPTKLKDSL